MTDQIKLDSGNRLSFLDNLKTFIIFLVVLYHAGWVYEGSGMLSSVWIVDDPAKNGVAGMLNLILDMFMMPTMFFISGFFTLKSIQRKSVGSFLLSRFKRLMVPWIIAALVLIPLYKIIYLYSRDLPQENVLSYFHFSGHVLINQGWLWFLPVLFLFDVTLLIFVKISPFQLNIGMKWAVAAAFLLGTAYSYTINTLGMYGWTKTALLDFQNDRLGIYFLAFLLGAIGYRNHLFGKRPSHRIWYYVACGTIWIPMNIYVIFLLNLIFNPGQFIISGTIDAIAVWSAFNLSMLGMLYILVCTFRYYLNRSGRSWQALAGQSYGVYIVHFVVTGVIALGMLDFEISSIIKYGLLTLSTFVVSHLLVYGYRELRLRVERGSVAVAVNVS